MNAYSKYVAPREAFVFSIKSQDPLFCAVGTHVRQRFFLTSHRCDFISDIEPEGLRGGCRGTVGCAWALAKEQMQPNTASHVRVFARDYAPPLRSLVRACVNQALDDRSYTRWELCAPSNQLRPAAAG